MRFNSSIPFFSSAFTAVRVDYDGHQFEGYRGVAYTPLENEKIQVKVQIDKEGKALAVEMDVTFMKWQLVPLSSSRLFLIETKRGCERKSPEKTLDSNDCSLTKTISDLSAKHSPAQALGRLPGRLNLDTLEEVCFQVLLVNEISKRVRLLSRDEALAKIENRMHNDRYREKQSKPNPKVLDGDSEDHMRLNYPDEITSVGSKSAGIKRKKKRRKSQQKNCRASLTTCATASVAKKIDCVEILSSDDEEMSSPPRKRSAELTKLRASSHTLEKEKAREQSQRKSAEERLSEFCQQLATARSEKENLEAQKTNLERKHAEDTKHITTELAKSKERIHTLEEEKAHEDRPICENEIAGNNGFGNENQVSASAVSRVSWENNPAQVQKLEDAWAKVKQLETEKAGLQTNIVLLQSKITGMESRHKECIGELERTTEEKKKLESQSHDAEAKYKETIDGLEEKTNEIRNVTEERNVLKKKVDELMSKFTMAESSVNILSSKRDDLQTQLAKEQAMSKSLSDNVKGITSKHKEELDEHAAKYEEVTQSKLLLEDEVTNLQREKQQLTQRCHTLEEENARSAQQTRNGQNTAGVAQEELNDKAGIMMLFETKMGTKTAPIPWNHIVGNNHTKQTLMNLQILSSEDQSWLYAKKSRKNSGILLHGPPGVGKTQFAQAVATHLTSDYICISAKDILNQYVGNSEKKIGYLFEFARSKAAVSGKPFVIFLDEVDGLFGTPGDNDSQVDARIIKEFQTSMQGFEDNEGQRILVIAATNFPEVLPASVLRRFGKRLHIKLPDSYERAKIFELCLKNRGIDARLSRDEYDLLAKLTGSASGGDIDALVENAIDEQIIFTKECKWWRACGNSYMPCSKITRGAVKMRFKDVGRRGMLPPLTFDFFDKAIEKFGITPVLPADIEKHYDFEQSGRKVC